MDALLKFCEGPLFRLAFVILIAGLLRQAVLIFVPGFIAWRRARDRTIPWGRLGRDLGMWMFPVAHVVRSRQIFSVISYLFHFGLILVPLFYSGHTALWAAGTGITIPTISDGIADILSLITIGGVFLLLLSRMIHPLVRRFVKFEDYFVLVLILIPFISGYAAGRPWNPLSYEAMRLVHVLSGNILLIAIPFTKLSHCIFFPFSRLCAELGSKLALDVNYEYRAP